MRLFRRPAAGLAVLAVLFAPAVAAADDSALNKEGYWTVGRGSADSDGCFASINTETEMLVMHAVKAEVSLTLGTTKGKLRRGKTGVLATDAYSFEFEPAYSEDGRMLGLGGDVNSRVLAALRLANELTVLIGDKAIFGIEVEGTGLEGALDAVVACSEGKSGWWGPGVGAEQIAEGPVPNKLAEGLVTHEGGAWAMTRGEEPGVCIAVGPVEGGREIHILAGFGRLGLAVASESAALPRGRKGRVETDAYRFDFKPSYSADTYVASDQPFDSQALFALRRAKWVRITVDGRPLVDATLENTGFAEVLDSTAACSLGESGWWGEGAAKP